MMRSPAAVAEGGCDDLMDLPDGSESAEMEPITGRVKWFDATRGFGFLVSDQVDGDILLHFSVLREHGRRSVPEGALIECVPMRLERGLQAKRVLSIDTSSALPQPGLRKVPLTIRSKTGTYRFTVQVAATLEQQERGLMFVTSLADDQGMIFPYEPPQETSFWMKNTLIPLDIIFIGANGAIARITHAQAMD